MVNFSCPQPTGPLLLDGNRIGNIPKKTRIALPELPLPLFGIEGIPLAITKRRHPWEEKSHSEQIYL